MSRYLVTFKPEKYSTPTHSYAILAEIDWSTQQIVREIRFPSAAFSDVQAYMAPSIGGVAVVNKRVFVAMWNYIVELDYDSFSIINTFSHPYMADLHGMDADGHYLYVASTAIDAILCFDIDSFDLIWRWGPDVPILYNDRITSQLQESKLTTVPYIKSRYEKRFVRMERFRDRDYRFRSKKISGHHHHHLNDVILHDNVLYITTKQWNDTQKGAVLQLDLASRIVEFFVQPDNLDGLHDGVWLQNRFYVTESGANQVAWCDTNGHVTHQKIEPSPYFVRGLCDTGTSWLVGFTTRRKTNLPAKIVEINRDFTEPLMTMDVSHFYPSEKSTAIHAIIRSPYNQNQG